MVTRRRLLRGALAAIVLGGAVIGLVLGLMIVLPTPNLGLLWPNLALDLLAVVAEGYSLWLAIFAVLGLALALLARRVGFRRSSLVAAVLGVVTVALSLVPVVQGWRTASQEGVALSLSEYFSFPSIGSPETVTYARPEGQELKLDVWRPPDQGDTAGPERRPAVVTVHGGGGIFGSRSDEAFWSEWLAEEGYVVFNIDYRLGDYRLGQPPRTLDATGDVKCAVGWVKENAGRYGVDPDRIALMGRSSGGHLALLAAYTEGDPLLPPSCGVPDTGVEAVAAFYSVTDQTRFDEMQWPWWRPHLLSVDYTRFTPDSEPEPDRSLISPTFHVDPGDPPTFLTHGGEDQWVPPEQSLLLANRLEEAGVPHRLIELPWARHVFDVAWGSWGEQIVRHELGEFLARHLAN
ncbi:MAG TPA: alpha/beta hydrolase [Propionibacteriaceae bacterium]